MTCFSSLFSLCLPRHQTKPPIATKHNGTKTAAAITPVLMLSSGTGSNDVSASFPASLPNVPATTGVADVSAVIVLGETLCTLLMVIFCCISLVNVVLSENVDVILVDNVFMAALDFTLTSYDTLSRERESEKRKKKDALDCTNRRSSMVVTVYNKACLPATGCPQVSMLNK